MTPHLFVFPMDKNGGCGECGKHPVDEVHTALRGFPAIPAEFEQPQPGPDGWTDWQSPTMHGYLMKCCDCGLVHEAQFQVVKVDKREGVNFEGELMDASEYRVQMRMRRP